MRDYGVLFLSNAGYFAALIFLPIYAETSLGATESQVGLIVAGGSLAGFLSSFVFGRLADVRGRRAVLLTGIALASIAVALQVLATDPVSLGISWFGFGFTHGMFPGALLAYAYEAGRPPGRFTSMGSVGWGAGTFLAGVVAALGSSEKWSFIFA
ncbi:MAG: MFS transporter, partial [Euryarchaeota archaeon]|nr:MFS transporter [Euryarchaeota archaeon]